MLSLYHHLEQLLARATGPPRPSPGGRRRKARPTVEGLERRWVPTVSPAIASSIQVARIEPIVAKTSDLPPLVPIGSDICLGPNGKGILLTGIRLPRGQQWLSGVIDMTRSHRVTATLTSTDLRSSRGGLPVFVTSANSKIISQSLKWNLVVWTRGNADFLKPGLHQFKLQIRGLTVIPIPVRFFANVMPCGGFGGGGGGGMF